MTLWDHRSIVHHALLADEVGSQRAADISQMAQQMTGGSFGDVQIAQAASLFESVVQLQARTLAFNDLCWIAFAIFLLLIPLVWLPKPPFGSSGGGGSGH